MIEVNERLILDEAGPLVGVTGEKLRCETPLDVSDLRLQLQAVLDSGITSIAIVFLHSFLLPEHEIQARDLALRYESLVCIKKAMSFVAIPSVGAGPCIYLFSVVWLG